MFHPIPHRRLVLEEWKNCKNKIASLKSKHQEMDKQLEYLVEQLEQFTELKIHLQYLISNKELAKEALEAYQSFVRENFPGDLFAGGNFPRFGRGREEAYEEEW